MFLRLKKDTSHRGVIINKLIHSVKT